MPEIKRCCGTCAHWAHEELGAYRQCEWEPMEPLPFWATINRGRDHEDSPAYTQGTSCLTWVAATRLVRG
jgi:hypothetical protein